MINKPTKEILKDIRYAQRMSQAKFAEEINVTHSTYQNWEQGRTEPTYSVMLGIIERFRNAS